MTTIESILSTARKFNQLKEERKSLHGDTDRYKAVREEMTSIMWDIPIEAFAILKLEASLEDAMTKAELAELNEEIQALREELAYEAKLQDYELGLIDHSELKLK